MFLVWLSPNSHQTRAIWYIKIWIPPETNVSMQGRHYCVITPKIDMPRGEFTGNIIRFFKGWKKLIQNFFTARESKLWIQIQNVLDLICISMAQGVTASASFSTPIPYYIIPKLSVLIDQDWQRCHPVYTKGVLMKHLIGPILAFMRGPVWD